VPALLIIIPACSAIATKRSKSCSVKISLLLLLLIFITPRNSSRQEIGAAIRDLLKYFIKYYKNTGLKTSSHFFKRIKEYEKGQLICNI